MIKYALNLDKNFDPTGLKSIKFEMLTFSGGEQHIKLDENLNTNHVVITHRIRNGSDIMSVALAKNALDLMDVKKIDLIMPYVPYGRQDRKCADGEAFSLKVFSNIINSLKFNKVYIVDAHSDISTVLIDNCVNISNMRFVEQTFMHISDTYNTEITLISPDSGANKKANKLFDELKLFKRLIKCDKKRNVKSGKLSGFEVFVDDLQKEDCLIVDDICDFGFTFCGIAEELKRKNAGDLYLFVTHGIFGGRLDVLKSHFKEIYCTDSFRDMENSVVRQIKINVKV